MRVLRFFSCGCDERYFAGGGGFAAWSRWIAGCAIGKDDGRLDLCAVIPAGGMEQAAMEKQHVARIELDIDPLRKQAGIFSDVGAQEIEGIKLSWCELPAMRAGNHFQAAIAGMFIAQRQPDGNQVSARK